MLDAVVIGGGPAGLAAATWLARYRRTVLVLDSGEYRNRWAEASHGYLGRDPVGPAELLARARADLAAYPTAEIRTARVVKVAADDAGGFEVATETDRLAGRRLVLATGVRDQFPEVQGSSSTTGRACSTVPPATATRPRANRWSRLVGASRWPASPWSCSAGPARSRW
jgi:thioredoxin reductase